MGGWGAAFPEPRTDQHKGQNWVAVLTQAETPMNGHQCPKMWGSLKLAPVA